MGSNFKYKELIAIGLLKLDVEKHVQKIVDAAKSIVERLIIASRLRARHNVTARQLERDKAGDATLEDRSQNKIRAVQSCIDTLSETFQLESDLNANKQLREMIILEVENIAERFTIAADDVVTSLAALAIQTELMARFLPDAAGLHSFAVKAKDELPGSIEMLTTLMRKQLRELPKPFVQAVFPNELNVRTASRLWNDG